MSEPIKYRAAFLKSKQHAILGFSTLGLGFIFGHAFPLILGVIAYVLGWIYIPDMPFFKNFIDGKNNQAIDEEKKEQLRQFMLRRDKLLYGLPSDLKDKYRDLVSSCEDIERETSTTNILAGSVGPDIRVKKLDELMWTYLRLLCMEKSLSSFLESEKKEYLEQQIQELEESLDLLLKKNENSEIDKRHQVSDRLIQSKTSMLETLKRRLTRIDDSIENIELVRAEQERLVEQIKLLRADAFAMQNSELLSQRIDASMEQLAQTNKWLSEMDTFKSALDNNMPAFEERVGYGSFGSGAMQSDTSKIRVFMEMNDSYSKPIRRISIKKGI